MMYELITTEITMYIPLVLLVKANSVALGTSLIDFRPGLLLERVVAT